MEIEKFKKAEQIKKRIDKLTGIKNRITGGGGAGGNTFREPVFGVTSVEPGGIPTSFNELEDGYLTDQLATITKNYCDEKLIELQKQFDEL